MKLARQTLIVCSVASAFLILLYFVYLARVVLVYLLVAALLAVAIMPFVRLIERRGPGRILATSIAMLTVLIVLIGVLAVILTPLVHEGVLLSQNFPAITQDVLANPTVSKLISNPSVKAEITQLSQHASSILLASSGDFIAISQTVIGFLSSTAIILVFTFLLIVDGASLWGRFLNFFAPAYRKRAEGAAAKISSAVSGFIGGNLLISGIAAVVTIILLYILKVPYVFALAALVALFDLIPLVGAALATVVVGFVALLQGPTAALIAVVVLILYQFIEGHFIQPLVYSKSIELSPLVVIIVTIVGAEVGGIGGVLLAIPLGAIISILGSELYDLYVHRKKAS